MSFIDTNMGTIDRVVRSIIGVLALIAGIIISPWFYAITIIFGITAIVGTCPIYKLFGISTIQKDTTEASG